MSSSRIKRNLRIVELKEKGETFAEIGKRCGITASRAQQLHWKMIHKGYKGQGESTRTMDDLTIMARNVVNRATGLKNPTLADFQAYVRDNPEWNRTISASRGVVSELENLCAENGIPVKKSLHTLGLDNRTCRAFERLTSTRLPNLDTLREMLMDPEWRLKLLNVMDVGITTVRKLEKFALEQGVLDEPENMLNMGLSPQAVAAIGQSVHKLNETVTLEDVKRAVGPPYKNPWGGVHVYSSTQKKVVLEIEAYAREHKLRE